MKLLLILTKRNTKMFFKEKGLFFTSLITPLILLLLYATFLGNVYHDSFMSGLPAGVTLDSKLVDGYVCAQLTSSILAVSCVTVAFCSNMLSVQDKANGTIKDLTITPVPLHTLSISYYAATFVATITVCIVATVVCFVYTAIVGWFMSFADVLLLLLDVFLLVMLGTALSGLVCHFLSSQGQISAVGSIVSSCYGFISGAYMPISQFSTGLQRLISFLPGTYGTSLLRNHAMRGVFAQMESEGLPVEFIEQSKKLADCNVYFFDKKVPMGAMYLILSASIILLISAYVLINVLAGKKKSK